MSGRCLPSVLREIGGRRERTIAGEQMVVVQAISLAKSMMQHPQ